MSTALLLFAPGFVAGACVTVVSYVLGHRRGVAKRRDVPQCSCGHARAFHGRSGCAETRSRQLYNGINCKAGTEWVKCECQGWDGPMSHEELSRIALDFTVPHSIRGDDGQGQ